MNPEKSMCEAQRKIQLEFDQIPYSMFVLSLMLVAGIIIVPVVLILEKTGVIKKIRH
jgi:hypothetical protein